LSRKADLEFTTVRQYGMDHKQHTIAQQMMLYSFQLHVKRNLYKKNDLPITYCDRKVVVSWCEKY